AYSVTSTDTYYGPLGAVIAASGATNPQGATTTEWFVNDAIGNRVQRTQENLKPLSHPDHRGQRDYFYAANGRLDSVIANTGFDTLGFYSARRMTYDLSANLALTKVT